MWPSAAIQMLAGLVLMRFGVTSPSHTKPNPPATPRQGMPRLALPRLPLPIARPALGVLPCGATSRSAAAFPGPSGQGTPGGHSSGTGKAQNSRERGRVPRPLPAGCLPTDGGTQVIRRTTTQPVRSIKGQRAADRCSHFLDHVSHINWQTCVAHLLSDHNSVQWRVLLSALGALESAAGGTDPFSPSATTLFRRGP
jgi:hypothetical protein